MMDFIEYCMQTKCRNVMSEPAKLEDSGLLY